jgi:hypothetical protein
MSCGYYHPQESHRNAVYDGDDSNLRVRPEEAAKEDNP